MGEDAVGTEGDEVLIAGAEELAEPVDRVGVDADELARAVGLDRADDDVGPREARSTALGAKSGRISTTIRPLLVSITRVLSGSSRRQSAAWAGRAASKVAAAARASVRIMEGLSENLPLAASRACRKRPPFRAAQGLLRCNASYLASTNTMPYTVPRTGGSPWRKPCKSN